MNAPVHRIEQLYAALPDLDWVTDAGRIGRLSQDFSWFSPVLKRQLEGKRADAVARPRTEDEIKRLVAACATLRVPITARGTGTGNYGQCVPHDLGSSLVQAYPVHRIHKRDACLVRDQTRMAVAHVRKEKIWWPE